MGKKKIDYGWQLEAALRKIANSGDPKIVKGRATDLEGALTSERSKKALVELLNTLIESYEIKHGKLDV